MTAVVQIDVTMGSKSDWETTKHAARGASEVSASDAERAQVRQVPPTGSYATP